MMRDAFDDLSLEVFPDPGGSTRASTYVRNNNRNRGIVAEVNMTSSSNFQLRYLSSETRRNFAPHQFSVYVPPGGRSLAGINGFSHLLDHDFSSGYRREPLDLTYTLLGGQYVTIVPAPNLPPPLTGVQSMIFTYRVPIVGSAKFLLSAVNLYPGFGVTLRVMASKKEFWSASLEPFKQNVIWESQDLREPLWKVITASYFELPLTILDEQNRFGRERIEAGDEE